MKRYKRIIAILLVICLFSTNSLTSFAQIIEEIQKESQVKNQTREVFEYPKANVYSKEEKDNSSNTNSANEEQTKEESLQEETQQDTEKENIDASSTDEKEGEKDKPKDVIEENKDDTSAPQNEDKQSDETKSEDKIKQDSLTEETKQEDQKTINKEESVEIPKESEKEELNYPTIEEDEDEFKALYGEPIEVTQYTKVYKTAEGTYKTVYSNIPNTYVDENGEEKEIDNTLEPVLEKKEVEVSIDKPENEESEKTLESSIESEKSVLQSSLQMNIDTLDTQQITDEANKEEDNKKEEATEKKDEEIKKVETKDVITGYTNANNNMEVTLPAKESDSNGISLSKDGFTVTLFPIEGDYSNPAVKENAILYNQVYDKVDIQYEVEDFGIKEDIILNEKTDKNEYTYRIAKEGIQAKLIDNAVYILKEGENIPSMVLSAPYMKDEAGAESKEITLQLEEKEKDYIITMIPDKDWLNSKERAYPIHIDPSISNIDKDIVIYSISSKENFVSSTTGYVGYSDDYGKSRSYVIIGHPFTGILPDKAVITNATLNLYQYEGNEKGNITCYRLESALPHEEGIEGMTWGKTASINREVAGEKSNFKSKKGMHEIDIRDTVSRWVEGIAPVHGLVLIADNETKTEAEFYTYESSGVSKSKKPKIVIDWKYEGELDENAYSLDDTTIDLRTLIDANVNGKHFFYGVYADGMAKPGATINYELNDPAKNFNSTVLAGFFKVFPDSSATNSLFPSSTTKYKDKLSNWQTMLPFVDYNFNVLYQINATASKDGATGKKAESETFLVYKVTQFDTMPKIAKYYGVPLSQMLFDNKAADMLVVKNNTLFIRNPKKNANKPYNPPKLDDKKKADIDALLMGRGLHCEFGFEPINLNTGNFYMEQTDASIKDETKDFAITRNYNGKDASRNSYFGRGWQNEYEEQISMDEDLNVIYSRGDGSSLVFTKNADTYTPPQGYDYNLEKNVVGTRTVNIGKKGKSYSVYEYTITDHDKTKKVFNEFGYLTSIIDVKGNRITITYDENYFMKQITSSSGLTYDVTCNENGNITAIKTPSGQILTYGYDEQENLVSFTNELGVTIRYNYDEQHRMTEWYNGNGTKVVQNTYDNENRIIRQIDANGRESTLSYENGKTITRDGNGAQTVYYYDDQYRTTLISYPNGSNVARTYQNNQMVSETDALGHTTTYEYDGNGNKIRETRYDGASKSYAYNGQNLLASETDYEGKQTTYEYDDKGNLTKVIQPENRVISYAYDGANHLVQITDAKGNRTTFTYQGSWINSITDAKGQAQYLAYNERGNIVSVTDKVGNTTNYAYDNAGRKVKETNAVGKSKDYVYDSAGNITSLTDENGGTTTFTHDGNGNILTLKDPLGRVYHYEYDALGKRTKMIDPKGLITSYEYDSMSNQTAITNAQGKTFRYEYDALSNLIKKLEPNGNATTYDYDYRNNQISQVMDSMGNTTAINYSANGLPISQTDANGNQIIYSYDGAGRIKQYVNANGLSVSYTYDQNNNITQTLYGDGKKYTFAYDTINEMVAAALPNEGVLTYTYDANSNLSKSIDTLGNESNYEHDAVGNLTAKIDANGNRTAYSYDGNSNLIQTTDPLGNTTKNVYDSLNQVTQMVDQNNYVTQYNYDETGNISAIIDALNQSTNYEFDQRGLVTKVADASGNIYKLEYDDNGNNTKIVAPNNTEVSYIYDSRNLAIKSVDSEGLETNYEYDKLGQLTKEENNAGDSMKYVYDTSGNVTSVTDSMGQTTTYTYDISNNLVKVLTWDGNLTQYDYDKMGNVTKITDTEGKITTYQYDKNNQLTSKEDQSLRTYQYTYDKLGRLTSDINPLGEKTSYAYDALGNLINKTDAAGNKEIFTYDGVGNLIANKDKNQNETAFAYDALGRVITVLAADKGKEQYLYDALGNLSKYQDAMGNVTNYSYDSVGQLSKLTTPTGGSYEYTYDGHGNNLSITNPLGAETKMEYDKTGQVIKKTLPNNAEYTYAYDVLGRITKVAGPENQSKQYEYDNIGNLVKEKDQSEREISYSYDKQHRLLTTTNEEEATTSYEYDNFGNLSSVISPLGGKSSYTYDKLDRITTLTDPVGKITELTYDIQGNLTKLTENGGRITQYGYDAMGNQTLVTNPLGQTTKYEYDNKNQMTAAIDPANEKTTYQYDKIGQMTAITDAKGKKIGLTYDGNGNITSVTDQEDRTIAYTYDLADQLVRAVDANQIETLYTYDNMGNLSSVTDGNKNTSTYTYDLLGRMTSYTNPLSEIQELTYDLDGRLKEVKQADGSKIQYDYDKLDQLVSVDYGEEKKDENILYAYDKEGRRISMQDVAGTTAYEYDEAGRIIKIKTSDDKEIKYSYDDYGNLNQLTYPDGTTVTYTYDELDRLTVLTDRNKKETHYTYDVKGNLIKVERPNQTTTKLEYDVLNQVTTVTNLDQKKKILSSYQYTYDNGGFITKEKEQQHGEKEIESSFSYDLRGQLTQVVKVEEGKETQIRYTYDKAGNRICIEKSEDTAKKQIIENQYNEANQLIRSNDSLTGETTYEYDQNGNMIKELAPGEEVVEYYYDMENRLNSVKEEGTLLMAALYDGDGNRIFTVEKTKSSYEETQAEHGDFVQGEQSKQKPVEWDTYISYTTWDAFVEKVRDIFIRSDVKTTINETTTKETQITTETTTTTNQKTEYKKYAPKTEITESKVYVDPTTHFFWYGFGQGMVQGFSGAPQYLSSWFNGAWDYITNQYYLVRHIKTTKYRTPEDETNTSVKVDQETSSKIDKEQKSIETEEELPEEIKSERTLEKEKKNSETEDMTPDDEPEGLKGYEKVLYDTVLIPSGTEKIDRENYRMTSYVNDVNQEYTQVLMEYDVNDKVASVYDYGVQRNSYTNQRDKASQTQYYVYDGRGSVSALTSVRGNAVITYQYDAYGKAKVEGESYSPYKYNAEAVDYNTGLQYLRARYYNNNTGGFLTKDTYHGEVSDPLTQNLYTYTGNNPVNVMDPSGHGWVNKVTNTIKNTVTKVVNTVKNTVTKVVNTVKNTVTKVVNTVKNTVTKVVTTVKNAASHITTTIKGGGSSTGGGGSPSTSSGGNSATDSFNTYLENQVDDPEPVDPVTASLQSRFGGAEVTNITNNSAYVNGTLVTALSDNENKMCTSAKNIQTKQKDKAIEISKSLQQISMFFGGFYSSILSNLSPIKYEKEPYGETYQIPYNKGQTAGDIVSAIIGIYTTVTGIGTIGKGAGLGGALAVSGIGNVAQGVSAGTVAVGVARTGYGLSITINAAQSLGKDVKKGKEIEESGESPYVKDNRVPLDKETVLSGKEYVKTKIKVKGATVYKNGDKYYYRDTLHTGKRAHLEVFDKKGNHLGEANPATGKLISNTADKSKKLKIK